LLGVHPELLDNDIFDFFFDGFFRHVINIGLRVVSNEQPWILQQES
jgi:hypothetical protein